MDLSWLIGHANIKYTHHPSTIKFRSKDGEETALADIAKEATPPCILNPLLFNGHLQTFWTAIKGTDVPVYYKRRIFSADEPAFEGTFAVDFVVPPYVGNDDALPPRTTNCSEAEIQAMGSDDMKPMVIALHGLSGGSYEIYLRVVLFPLIQAGWEACVVNSRGCAMSKITTGILYNARATWDARQVIKWARERWPNRKLFAIGFSLGASILANYLGEEGDKCPLKAAVVCSNPWNLDVSSMLLQKTWIGLEIYSKAMGSSIKKMFENHVEEISKNTRVDIERVRQTRYLHEFDREVQVPTWGYPTVNAYYRDASSCDSLLAIRTPLLAINAEDDPIAFAECIPYDEFKINPYVVLCTTSKGGHLSWFETGGTRWFAKPASNFLIRMAEDIDQVVTESLPNGVVGKGVSIADRPPPFLPMRRRLQLQVSDSA